MPVPEESENQTSLNQRSNPTNVLQLHQKPMHSPKVALGAPLASGGSQVTAGSGGDSEQAYSGWEVSALDPGPGMRVTKLFHFHLFTAVSPQDSFSLDDFFFLLPTKPSERFTAFSRDWSSSTNSKSVLCISEIRCNPSTKTGTLTCCLSAWALPGATAQGREKVSVLRLRFSTAPHCFQLQPQQSLPHVRGTNCWRWATALAKLNISGRNAEQPPGLAAPRDSTPQDVLSFFAQ